MTLHLEAIQAQRETSVSDATAYSSYVIYLQLKEQAAITGFQ